MYHPNPLRRGSASEKNQTFKNDNYEYYHTLSNRPLRWSLFPIRRLPIKDRSLLRSQIYKAASFNMKNSGGVTCYKNANQGKSKLQRSGLFLLKIEKKSSIF
jgi:hypothetical protein